VHVYRPFLLAAHGLGSTGGERRHRLATSYDSRNTTNGDAADVFYIRSSDGGLTFTAPFKLNTDTTTKRQWQPNISAAADGSLLAVWYDERNATANCVKGNAAIPCYQMFARRSVDNGITWAPTWS
jgi:hypothetical protein